MRVFAKKAFRFDHPTGAAEPVHTQALSFHDVPEWVKDSLMFKLASADGDVTVTETAADESAAEKSTTDHVLKALKAQAKELGIQGYGKMKSDELAAAVEEALKEKQQENKPPVGDPPAGVPPVGDPPSGE